MKTAPRRILHPACLLVLSLVLPGAAAAAPANPRCDKGRAEEAFLAGMRNYDQHCREVIPRLNEAAAVCPVPDQPWFIRPNPFLEYSYLPFYFLGKCHYNLKDLPNALRQFYLSSCANEPKRDKERTGDLDSLTTGCRKQLKSNQRPNAYFSEGFAAAQQRDWGQAAEKMWNALQVFEEDGATVLPSGRWPAPYLPRFRLAEALLQLGCYQEACAQLDKSKVKLAPDKKEFELERKRMGELQAICERMRREGLGEKAMCRQWGCWLERGGP